MPRSRLLLSVCLVALSLLLVGCGSTSGATSRSGSPTATAMPTASPTPYPTPLSTAAALDAFQRCHPLEGFGTLYQLGDLAVGVSLSNVAWPSLLLPSTLPKAPYKVVEQQLPTTPAVNPHHDFLFGLVVCNTAATATHTLEGVRVRIDSFVPSSGPVNSWWFCSSTYVSGSVRGGGCGGAYTAHEFYQASFAASAGVGAIADGTFVKGYNPDTGGSAGSLPRSLAPGQSLVLALSLTPPTAAGTYTFALSAGADGAQLPFASVPDQILFDAAATQWDGQSCLAPAMKAQIPAGSADSYICPVTS
jgi:hypothetical protein